MTFTPVEDFGEALVETAAWLISRGSKVAILLEPPAFKAHVPRQSALHVWRGLTPPSLSLAEHTRFNQDYADIVSQLRKQVPGVVLIDPLPAFLNPDDMIQSKDADGTLLFRDEHHLTPRGVTRLVPLFKDFFKQSSHIHDASTD